MSELVTAAQMRAIEQAAIASGAVTGLELMERAGQGVVDAMCKSWPELADGAHSAVVLCGPGNNGGDGFVIARLLVARGWSVEVFLYGDPGKLPADARANYARWTEIGEVAPLDNDWNDPGEAEVIVDALFGTGLTRPVALPRVLLALAESRANGGSSPPGVRRGRDTRVVAVDMPSGLCSDSGRALTREGSAPTEGGVGAVPAAEADLTVTFHALKQGHVLADCPGHTGRVFVHDIGIETGVEIAPVQLVDAPGQLAKGGGHKFGHGHALILSGPSGKTGAARLAARAALRVGAGLATLATPHEALAENAAHLTAIMLREVDDAAALERVLEDARLNALALGPGLGQERARELVPVALAATRATVLDADALSAFAGDPARLLDRLHGTCVLTPHGGEFARLFPDIAEELAATPTRGPAFSKVDATRMAAARAGCTVLFKGADTVIASPDGRCAVNAAVYDRAAPWLATAGTGDVLTGLITGLLARGFDPLDAASTAAWLHTEAARSFGPGLIAEDLPEELPRVLRALSS